MWIWPLIIVLLTVGAAGVVLYPLFSGRFSARQRAERRLRELRKKREALYAEIVRRQSEGAAESVIDQLQERAAALMQREEQISAALSAPPDAESNTRK